MAGGAAGQGSAFVGQRLPVSADAIGSARKSSAGISMCLEGNREAHRHEMEPGLWALLSECLPAPVAGGSLEIYIGRRYGGTSRLQRGKQADRAAKQPEISGFQGFVRAVPRGTSARIQATKKPGAKPGFFVFHVEPAGQRRNGITT